MKLLCMIATGLLALSANAFAHDPTVFGGEPHDNKPTAAKTPTTCEQLKKTAKADLDTRDPKVKALQEKCAAEDKAARNEDASR